MRLSLRRRVRRQSHELHELSVVQVIVRHGELDELVQRGVDRVVVHVGDGPLSPILVHAFLVRAQVSVDVPHDVLPRPHLPRADPPLVVGLHVVAERTHGNLHGEFVGGEDPRDGIAEHGDDLRLPIESLDQGVVVVRREHLAVRVVRVHPKLVVALVAAFWLGRGELEEAEVERPASRARDVEEEEQIRFAPFRHPRGVISLPAIDPLLRRHLALLLGPHLIVRRVIVVQYRQFQRPVKVSFSRLSLDIAGRLIVRPRHSHPGRVSRVRSSILVVLLLHPRLVAQVLSLLLGCHPKLRRDLFHDAVNEADVVGHLSEGDRLLRGRRDPRLVHRGDVLDAPLHLPRLTVLRFDVPGVRDTLRHLHNGLDGRGSSLLQAGEPGALGRIAHDPRGPNLVVSAEEDEVHGSAEHDEEERPREPRAFAPIVPRSPLRGEEGAPGSHGGVVRPS
mmetsp:Transcript_650/g.2395  ORF Transcript_650/g.2395 Transcript_650/m.2395 type:complete len:449 (+) Transcript_650:2117-3463(+)